MPEVQAEVLARSQAKLINEQLATKQDLKELEERLHRGMKELELRLNSRPDGSPRLDDGDRRRCGRRPS